MGLAHSLSDVVDGPRLSLSLSIFLVFFWFFRRPLFRSDAHLILQEVGRNITGAAYRFKEVRGLFRAAAEAMQAEGELTFLPEMVAPNAKKINPNDRSPFTGGRGGGGSASGSSKTKTRKAERKESRMKAAARGQGKGNQNLLGKRQRETPGEKREREREENAREDFFIARLKNEGIGSPARKRQKKNAASGMVNGGKGKGKTKSKNGVEATAAYGNSKNGNSKSKQKNRTSPGGGGKGGGGRPDVKPKSAARRNAKKKTKKRKGVSAAANGSGKRGRKGWGTG